jgi:hypothetical protein
MGVLLACAGIDDDARLAEQETRINFAGSRPYFMNPHSWPSGTSRHPAPAAVSRVLWEMMKNFAARS